MALLPLSGPGGQTGRSANGQYVYWICMAHPTQETLVAKPGMKTPADFSRESFTELVVNVHYSCTAELEEVACFLELQAKRTTTPRRVSAVAQAVPVEVSCRSFA